MMKDKSLKDMKDRLKVLIDANERSRKNVDKLQVSNVVSFVKDFMFNLLPRT